MYTAKQNVVAAIMIALAQWLWGFNEVLQQMFQIPVSKFCLIMYSVQLLVTVCWWNLQRPPAAECQHWFGDTTAQRLNIWGRGLLQSTCIFYWYACIVLPLGDMQTIYYQAPLWIVLFSWLVFSDTLPVWYLLITSTVCTVSGVLLVSQPDFMVGGSGESLNIGGVIAIFISAIRWVGSVFLVKSGDNVHFLQYIFSSTICTVFISVPLLFVCNVYVIKSDDLGTFDDLTNFSISEILICVYVALATTAAMSFNVIGYQKGNATVISWLEYINIPLAFLYQVYIFKDPPNGYEVFGAVLVSIGSVLPFTPLMIEYFAAKQETSPYPLDNELVNEQAPLLPSSADEQCLCL